MESPQQVCEAYPVFQSKVFEMALDPDPVMIGVALDTLGLLGSTVEGKQVLHKTGQQLSARRSSRAPATQSHGGCVSYFISVRHQEKSSRR